MESRGSTRFRPSLSHVCPSHPRTLQRYQHYITNGISSAVLASLPEEQLAKILRQLPSDTARSSVNLPRVRADVQEEAKRDYHLSMKKSIGMNLLQLKVHFVKCVLIYDFCIGKSLTYCP